MSEYWKSTPKYWCKQCSTFVKDTPFERKQHEATGKHQGNLKRSLRTIQNDHERNEREKQKAKAEVERLNKVVGKSGSASIPSPTTNTTARKVAAGQPSAADQKRQWAQLAEMGIQVPDSYSSEMAMPSNWKVVSQQQLEEPSSETPLSTGIRKRKLEENDEEDEAEQPVVRKGWGSTTKRYPGEATEDLDSLLSSTVAIKTKDKSEEQHTKKETASFTKVARAETNLEEGEKQRERSPRSTAILPKAEETKTDQKTETMVKSEDSKEDLGMPNDQPTEPALVPSELPVFKKRKSKAATKIS